MIYGDITYYPSKSVSRKIVFLWYVVIKKYWIILEGVLVQILLPSVASTPPPLFPFYFVNLRGFSIAVSYRRKFLSYFQFLNITTCRMMLCNSNFCRVAGSHTQLLLSSLGSYLLALTIFHFKFFFRASKFLLLKNCSNLIY